MIRTFVKRLSDKLSTIIETHKGRRFAKNGDNIIHGIIIGLNKHNPDIFEMTCAEKEKKK